MASYIALEQIYHKDFHASQNPAFVKKKGQCLPKPSKPILLASGEGTKIF